jgi:uncharacterized protein (TIGR02466 family)
MEQNSFFVPIFQTPLLIGTSSNLEIRSKIISLVETFKNNEKNAKLVSDKWGEEKSSYDNSDVDKYGITTFQTKNLLIDPEWADVISFIADFSGTMLSSMTKNTSFKFSNIWATFYPPGAYVPQHTHSNCALSGVFYVKAPKNCGNIVFQDPSWVAKSMIYNKNAEFPKDQTRYDVSPEDGMMIIFPSWLPHSTKKNLSTDSRIIISFNIEWGEMNE